MKKTLLLFSISAGLFGQTTISGKRLYDTAGVGNGVVLVTSEGVKIAGVHPGFSYFSGDDRAHLMSSYCSANHAISEEPTQDANGRYVLRMRPNPALLAVYRGGVRLEPTIHYRLVYLEDGKLPDRFELTAAAPTAGKVLVDYTIGTIPLPTCGSGGITRNCNEP